MIAVQEGMKIDEKDKRLTIHLMGAGGDRIVIYQDGTEFKRVRCDKEGRVIAGPVSHPITEDGKSLIATKKQNKMPRIFLEYCRNKFQRFR